MTSTTKASTTIVPAAAKKPQDRKPKDEKPTVKQVAGAREVTHLGFTVTVADDALDDFELLGDLHSMQADEDPSYFPSILKRLVGAQGYRDVMDGLRDPATGRVPIQAGSEYIQSIFEALNPNF
ncbi:hypothetical protein GCM10025865_01250 [Paraoerskovia sediminicola]|uniref:Tail assembly chaperone n=1 Tax=Paraoerskovia sediminicola TaxID=1138587 RepID=A0ABM8FYY1_9CELL|nr:hypothetical protein [Paraoerskovia sediminicola]BDZ40826.1 hypothetical protein GCM10025865_01250 [Paraoerskovia sediminicola]